MPRHVFRINPDGSLDGLYTDALDFQAIGHVQITRASTIEWDEPTQGWTVHLTHGPRLPGLYPKRQHAIDAEIDHLHTHLRR